MQTTELIKTNKWTRKLIIKIAINTFFAPPGLFHHHHFRLFLVMGEKVVCDFCAMHGSFLTREK